MNKIITDISKNLYFNYFIKMKYEAGMVLRGWEVKSIKVNGIDLLGSFILIKNSEVVMINSIVHVGNFVFNFDLLDESRDRQLLLNKKEIATLKGFLKIKGNTLVPAKVYFKGSLLKTEIFLCFGKKLYDKRYLIKEKEWNMSKNRLINYTYVKN